MAPEPHQTKPRREDGGIWFARIRSDATRPDTERRDGQVDPRQLQQLEEAAAAADRAAHEAARAARAADHAARRSGLLREFAPRHRGELAEAAGRSIEAGAEALAGADEAAIQGHLAQLGALQDTDGAGSEGEVERRPDLGTRWHLNEKRN